MGTLKSRTHKRRVFVYCVLYCFSLSHLRINFPRIHIKTPYRCLKLRVSKSHLVMRETKGTTVPVNTLLLLLWFLLFSWTVFWTHSEGYVCFDVLRLPVLFLERILSLITLNQTVSAEPVAKNLSFFVLSCHVGLVCVGRRTKFFFVFLPLVFQFGTNGKLFKRFLFLFLSLISSPQIHLTPILSGEC